ncbi:MAG TPA: hypothetical protein VGB70_11570 [Allosphingosinicella sp.]|jgi:hypothetical protein
MDLVAAAAPVSFSPSFSLQPLAACPVLSDLFDPLEADDRGDAPVLTTERRLRRLAIVAADTGARFARERIDHDPVAWLLAPRTLFDGRRPLEACQSRTGFLRAALLNGLSLGLDADPAEVDALTEEREGDAPRSGAGASAGSQLPEPRFYSCSIDSLDYLDGGAVVWVMSSADEQAARARLRARYGDLAERAVIWEVLASPDGLDRADDFLSKLLVVVLGAAGDAALGVEFRLEIGRLA